MTCKKIGKRKKQVCVGSLNTLIDLFNRDITEPTQGSTEYTETFTPDITVWGNFQTTQRGEQVFDGTNTVRTITHEAYIRYISDITSGRTWVGVGDIYYDIIDVTDFNEDQEWLHLRMDKRGPKNLPINQQ